MILTGADGLLKYGGGTCVKVRNWSLNISRDAIDVTCLNTYDREYVAGLRSATGSATLYYDPAQAEDRALLNSISERQLRLRWNDLPRNRQLPLEQLPKIAPATLKQKPLITSVSPAVEVGAATAVQVSFQISGPIDGTF